MNRREFIKRLGLSVGAFVIAPVVGPVVWESIRRAWLKLFAPPVAFEQIAFPLIRRVYPAIRRAFPDLAEQLVSVQPMALPSTLVFFTDFTYFAPGSPKRLETVWRAHQAAKLPPLCTGFSFGGGESSARVA
jgi:hypothetical protein